MSILLTRRSFLSKTSIYGGGVALALRLPLAEAAARLSSAPEVLSAEQWRSAEAMSARIIPSDDSPGAREANCVNFIDKALANEEKDAAGLVKGCLDELSRACIALSGKRFEDLDAEKQDQVLRALETDAWEPWPDTAAPSSAFFETIRVFTIIGFLADPRYGGNRNYVGWQTAGYPGPRHHRNGYTPKQMLGEEPIVAVWEEREI